MIKMLIIITYVLSVFTFGIIAQKTQPLAKALLMSIAWPVAAAGSAAMEINRMHLLREEREGEER